MNLQRIHTISGIILLVFVLLHLGNHLVALKDVEDHLNMMEGIRPYYRNIFSETILLVAIAVQVYSGIYMFKRVKSRGNYNTLLQKWSGLYLAVFFIFHLSAVFAGRFLLNLDTNFYYGAAGLNSFPENVFFIPYYGLAIISIVFHAGTGFKNMITGRQIGNSLSAGNIVLLGLGVLLALITIYGLTGKFSGVEIPEPYHILTLEK